MATDEFEDALIASLEAAEQVHSLKNASLHRSNSITCASDKSVDEMRAELISRYRLWPHLVRMLYDYQVIGVHVGISKFRGRMMLCDEMGLGKTWQAIAIASYFMKGGINPNSNKLLIAVKASLRLQWADAIEALMPSLSPLDIRVVSSGSDRLLHLLQPVAERPSVIIVSHALCRQLYDVNIAIPDICCVIVDEAQCMRLAEKKRYKGGKWASESKQADAISRIVMRARYALLLTGTPIFSEPCQLWPFIHSLLGCSTPHKHRCSTIPWPSQDRAAAPIKSKAAPWKSYTDFCKQFMFWKPEIYKWIIRNEACKEELRRWLFKNIMVRRLTTDVDVDIPDSVREVYHIEVEKELIKRVEDFAGCGRSDVPSSEQTWDAQFEKSTLLGLAKVEWVAQRALYELQCGRAKKILIWFHHIPVGRKLQSALTGTLPKHYRVGFIDGSVTTAERDIIIQEFKNPCSSTACLIMGIKCGNAGLNLGFANVAIFSELWPVSAATMLQAERRIVRAGCEDARKSKKQIYPVLSNCAGIESRCGWVDIDQGVFPILFHQLDRTIGTVDGKKAAERGKKIERVIFNKALLKKHVEHKRASSEEIAAAKAALILDLEKKSDDIDIREHRIDDDIPNDCDVHFLVSPATRRVHIVKRESGLPLGFSMNIIRPLHKSSWRSLCPYAWQALKKSGFNITNKEIWQPRVDSLCYFMQQFSELSSRRKNMIIRKRSPISDVPRTKKELEKERKQKMKMRGSRKRYLNGIKVATGTFAERVNMRVGNSKSIRVVHRVDEMRIRCESCTNPFLFFERSGISLNVFLTSKVILRGQNAFLTCSQQCARSMQRLRYHRSLRSSVRERDKGVCENCKLDTLHLFTELKRTTDTSQWFQSLKDHFPRGGMMRGHVDWMSSLIEGDNASLNEGNFWHADHICAVADGGGLAQLEDMQTLCLPCHKVKTAQECTQRAKKKRKKKSKRRTKKKDTNNKVSTPDTIVALDFDDDDDFVDGTFDY